MPISKSAKKAYVSSERKRARNLIWEKKLKKALKAMSKENAGTTISLVDKAAKRQIISRGKANRLKSQITKKYGSAKKTEVEKKVKTTKSKAKSSNVKSNPKS